MIAGAEERGVEEPDDILDGAGFGDGGERISRDWMLLMILFLIRYFALVLMLALVRLVSLVLAVAPLAPEVNERMR